MPLLIDLLNTTKLKSLKWGNDKPNGGNSKQPYIKVDINQLDSFASRIRFANKTDDGLVRGGVVGSAQAAITDFIRIEKFMTDFPKGPLFIAKQVGLQLSNPKLQSAGIKNIRGESLFANVLNQGINVLNENEIGPTRIYNLGINTLAQVPVGHLGVHIQRHGFNPLQNNERSYYSVLKNQWVEDNKLVKLKTKFFDDIIISNRSKTVGKQNFFQKLSKALTTNVPSLRINSDSLLIDDYIGGPNSTYGIGRTRIRRYEDTNNPIATEQSLIRSKSVTQNFELNYLRALGLSEQYFNKNELARATGVDENKPTLSTNILNPRNKTFEEVKKAFDKLDDNKRIETRANGTTIPNMTTTNWINNGSKIEYKNTQTGAKINIKTSAGWKSLNRETRVGSGRQDQINLTPIFESGAINNSDTINIEGKTHNIRDMVKFRIEAIKGENPELSDWMIFRAYIKGYTDTHIPTVGSVKYIGRGEEFYTYQSYSRRVSFNFKVAALSAEEMKPIYQKLNFLASNTAPDYSSDNLMRMPLIRVTIGNYLYRQPCFIDTLTYTIADETPWEIAIDEPEQGKLMYELPHIIDVSISFQIIHDFLPRKSVGEAPFIVFKPSEKITGEGAADIDNPWLKDKDGKPLTSKPIRK